MKITAIGRHGSMAANKLTDRQRQNIAKLYGGDLTAKEVAKKYGVSNRTITNIWEKEKERRGQRPKSPGETGIWLSVMDNKEQKQIQVIRFEGKRKILTEDGAKYVTKQARSGCIAEEIASMLGVDYDTLTNDVNGFLFRSAYKKGYDECNNRLRKAQVQSALDGNSTMQIWLGKARLNQSDKSEVVADDSLERFAEIMRGKYADR